MHAKESTRVVGSNFDGFGQVVWWSEVMSVKALRVQVVGSRKTGCEASFTVRDEGNIERLKGLDAEKALDPTLQGESSRLVSGLPDTQLPQTLYSRGRS
ncbi:uncharacterized protein N7482_006753 [Penicillium canariense]|uniref:Uncharacterized protein n=1 Tax=Penicillium canariense TaxID=189055 RepID=A0A9W9HVE5_9EURO|nr:uncharacterized protein N7482_006753 [Penicillium canariense]KAJ5159749.1 hypothetical protein N7482_006753 [Penicillium canariense]